MRRLVLGALSAVLLIPACSGIPSLAPIAEAGAGIQRAGVSAESAAVSLRRGLEGLDPAGIRDLLATNDRLRADLERVQKLYLEGMGDGVVDITGRSVQIRVTRTVGDLLINAWINNPSNQFWSGRITNREARLPVDIAAFLQEYPERRCRGQTGAAGAACLVAARRVAPTAAEVLIQQQFQRYLRSVPAVPAPELPHSIANPRFGGSGEHRIFFEVVPVAGDVNGNWAARLEIWLVDGAGREANVFVYDVDNRRYPEHRLEHPLAPIVATLMVRTGSER